MWWQRPNVEGVSVQSAVQACLDENLNLVPFIFFFTNIRSLFWVAQTDKAPLQLWPSGGVRVTISFGDSPWDCRCWQSCLCSRPSFHPRVQSEGSHSPLHTGQCTLSWKGRSCRWCCRCTFSLWGSVVHQDELLNSSTRADFYPPYPLAFRNIIKLIYINVSIAGWYCQFCECKS